MYKKRLQFAIQTLINQGATLVKELDNVQSFNVRAKADKDYVTDLDIAIEKQISKKIQQTFPHDKITGEEGIQKTHGSAYEWIIDPIDGTNNYIRSIPWVGMHIALLFNDVIVAAVVYQPFSGQVFFAEKGKGAFKQMVGAKTKHLLKVSDRTLAKSLLIYESAIVNNTARSLSIFQEIVKRVDQVRMPGVAAYEWMFVASGVADLLIYDLPKIVDIAPGTLILEEAGGVVTDFDGKPWSREMNGVIAGTPKSHKAALNLIKTKQLSGL